ncbi:hypothetical protein EYF80_004950 [Liparis tanakae]|uniref:Uncharacterized protein n=1 Tax=Liparis tanakae TaxID=230148 RepID=A0A4Z2J3I5_9TELE|nr:hypothetical protein EYF80_004950 [Liparis tanakae]
MKTKGVRCLLVSQQLNENGHSVERIPSPQLYSGSVSASPVLWAPILPHLGVVDQRRFTVAAQGALRALVPFQADLARVLPVFESAIQLQCANR